MYIDDGSTDSTLNILRELQSHDKRIRAVRFSRNFGHQMAITAGLEHAAGDAIVIIDADLQDPPAVIAEFVQKWADGYDVVYGVRTDREGETAFKKLTAKFFYRFMSHMSDTQIPLDTGDFRLMDRRVVDTLLSMPERDRFVRGMVSWLGFSQFGVSYRRAPRFAGVTKFSFFKMLRFALDGVFSFSTLPLRLATWVGFAASNARPGWNRGGLAREVLRSAWTGQRLVERDHRGVVYRRCSADLHGYYWRIRWQNLRRVEAAATQHCPGEDRVCVPGARRHAGAPVHDRSR